MIDFSSMTLPDPNDYYKLNDGSYKTKTEVLNDPNTQFVDQNAGYAKSEVNQLTSGLKASGYGLLGAVTGDQDYINKAVQNQQVSSLYSKPYDSIEGVNSIGDVAKLAGHYVIQGLPQIGAAIATGGLGGIGAGIANKAVGGIVSEALAQKIGTLGGQFIANSAISAGQSAADDYANGNTEDATKNALIASVIGGIGGTFADQQLLGKFGVTGSRVANAVIGAGFNAGIGAGQVALQNNLQGKETSNTQLLDAALGGGLIGGAFGAFHKGAERPVETTLPRSEESVTPKTETNPEATELEQAFDLNNNEATPENIQNTPDNIAEVDNSISPFTGEKINPEVLGQNETTALTKDDLVTGGLKSDKFLETLNTNEEARALYQEDHKFVEKTFKKFPDEFNEKVSEELNARKLEREVNNNSKDENINNPEESIKTPEENVNKENLPEDIITPKDEEVNQVVENKPEEVMYNKDKENVIQEAITKTEEATNLTPEETSFVTKGERDIAPFKDKLNVDVQVLHEKQSPFINTKDSDAQAWYDPNQNKIFVLAGKNMKESVANLLSHELVHNGIYKMVKGSDLEAYKKEMENLYRNKDVAILADKLKQEQNLDFHASVEEALANFAQNKTLDNLPMKNRIINFVRNFVNKLIGRKELVTEQDVKDFLSKADTYNYRKPIENQNHIQNNLPIERSPIMFSKAEAPKIEEMTEKEIKEIMDKVGTSVDQAGVSRKSDKYSLETPEDFLKRANVIREDLSSKNNWLHMIGGLTHALKTTRKIGEKYLSVKKLISVQDKRMEKQNAMSYGVKSDIERINTQNKKLSSQQKQIVNSLMHNYGIQENAGKGRRPTEAEFRKALEQNKMPRGKIDDAVKYYNDLRGLADNGIFFSMFRNLQDPFSALENVILKANNVKDTVLPDFRYLQSQILDGNIKDATKKINKFFIDNKNELSNVLQTPEANNFKKIMSSINDELKLAKESYDNGYIPKDHSGKYALNVYLKYKDKDTGEEKEKTFAISASNDRKDVVAHQERVKNDLLQKLSKGEITEKELNSIQYKIDERPNAVEGLDPRSILNLLDRNGIALDDSIRDHIYSTSSDISNDLRRGFKQGYGSNSDIQQIVSKSIQKNIKDISQNLFKAEEANIANSIDKNNGVEQNIFREVQERFHAQETGKGTLSTLKKLTSTFTLAGNVASFFGQMAQFVQAAPVHFSQYTGTTGITETTRALNLARLYMQNGTTGITKYDEAIKNFKHPLLDASQTKMLFDTSSSNLYEKNSLGNKLMHLASIPMEKAEMASRYANFIVSHDIYEKAQNGTLSGRKAGEVLSKYNDKNDFILNQLVRINGDYSSYNRPKILQGEFAQLFGMFQMWKVVMAEQFKHLDTKGKIAFMGSIALTAGLRGIPFEQDIEEIIDSISQVSGGKPIAKEAVNHWLLSVGKNLGVNGNVYLERGIFPALGQRIGVGDVIPGLKGITELVSGSDNGKALQDFVGPGLSTIVNAGQSANALGRGDISTALRLFAPTAIKNVIKGGEEINNGYSLSNDGTKRIAKTDSIDGLVRVLGLFTPDQQNQMDKSQIIQDLKDSATHIQSYYKTQWMQAKMRNDNETANEIVKNMLTFNKLELKEKSGYAFNLDLGAWNKELVLNKTSAVQRANISSTQYQQIANKENIGADLKRNPI